MNEDARLKGNFEAKISNFHSTTKSKKFTVAAEWNPVQAEWMKKPSASWGKEKVSAHRLKDES